MVGVAVIGVRTGCSLAAAVVATGGTAVVAGGIAIGGAAVGLTNIVGQGVTNGWNNINIGQVGTSLLNGAAIGGLMGLFGIGATLGGSLALAGGGTVGVGAQSIFGLLSLASILFSIDYHGKPNSEVGSGNSIGIYDGNGNLIYRRDFAGRPHYIPGKGYTLPHTHGFLWKYIKGAWRIVGRFILPF